MLLKLWKDAHVCTGPVVFSPVLTVAGIPVVSFSFSA